MSEKDTWASKASLWTATAGVVASLVAASITFLFDKSIQVGGIKFEPAPPHEIRYAHDAKLEEELKSIKAQIQTITDVPNDAAVAAKLSEVEAKLDTVTSQVAVINKAIMQSPEKALEIPILKRDIESLQKQYEGTTQALEREITRAYDTIKWVIGTIVLGILGLAASVFLRAKEDE